MKQRITLTVILFLFINNLFSQTGIRAWYAKGQVWIVWQTAPSDSSIYEIYESDNLVTSSTNAQLIGRLFSNEWKAGALRDQVTNSMKNINFRIPTARSTYRLDRDEGLFVKTPHDNGVKYYAVVKKGKKAVVFNVNGTDSIRHFYDPVRDPVQCHPQLDTLWDYVYKGRYYYMWADGRREYWNSRPDFPVMANIFKNGMPSLFIISEGEEMDTTAGKKIPATLWLHGGGGSAISSISTSRQEINIKPKKGILVAHNDDFFRIDSVEVEDTIIGFHSNTWFFGWAKNEDPFDRLHFPLAGDTIINYTQRRLIWINDWLIKNYNVDSNIISVNGHSMGSAGATALMKSYPQKFATATIFNNGLDGPDLTDQGYHLFGDRNTNLPTNLIRRSSADPIVRIYQAFNLNDRNSTERDLPLVRMFHGKNDDRGLMKWDAYVVQEYRKADSLGWGMQLYWGERNHGLEGWWLHKDHWSFGLDSQTIRDNVSYEETYRSDISYPAFFNHRLDQKNHDPGDGTVGADDEPGTDISGVGHDWGTWGGYHDWNRQTIIDSTQRWRVTAWLIDSALFAADNSPNKFLTADVTLRRTRQFKPLKGTSVNWYVIDTLTLDTLQRGTVAVNKDDIVFIPGVKVYKRSFRKVYIEVRTFPAVIQPSRKEEQFTLQTESFDKSQKNHVTAKASMEQIMPNPLVETARIGYYIPSDAKTAQLIITTANGSPVRQTALRAGSGISYIHANEFRNGIYIYTLVVDGKVCESRKMIVLR